MRASARVEPGAQAGIKAFELFRAWLDPFEPRINARPKNLSGFFVYNWSQKS